MRYTFINACICGFALMSAFLLHNVCVVYCHGFRKPRVTVAECKLHILGCALIRIPFIRSCIVLLHTYVISITP